jgi:hypothetical protein
VQAVHTCSSKRSGSMMACHQFDGDEAKEGST